MGARSAYTLATALFVGAAGIFGFFDVIFLVIPKAVIFPILIFIGLEITAQSFHATPVAALSRPSPWRASRRWRIWPSLAVNQVLPALGKPFDTLPAEIQRWIQTVTVLAGGGTFIVTSLLWATALSHLIDGRIRAASLALILAGFLALLRRHPFAPCLRADRHAGGTWWNSSARRADTRRPAHQTPYHWSAAYVLSAVALAGPGATREAPHPALSRPASTTSA